MVTINDDGAFNPAPMGVMLTDGILTVKSYKTSKTYENLLRGGEVFINLTNDPMLFLVTAFKDEFIEETSTNDYWLSSTSVVVQAEVKERLHDRSLYSIFSLIPSRVNVLKQRSIAFSRARAASIEAIIHATRIQVFNESGRMDDVRHLVHLVKENIDVIKKVSGDTSDEVKVVKKLVSMIKHWGVEI